MSTSVDVLAVMDREVSRAGGDSYPDGRDLIAARAAVAELIEACYHLKRSATNDRWDAFHAALDRVEGA